MASKKDKFRKEVKKSLGQEDPSMEGIVGEIAGRRTEKSRKEQGPETESSEESRNQPSLSDETSERSSEETSRPSEKSSAAGEPQSDQEPGGPEFLSEVDAGDESTTTRDTVDFEKSESSESRISGPSSGRNSNENVDSSSKKDRDRASERIDSTGHSKKTGARSMARKRESIYNVSSDIRLEDYTEADRQKSNNSMFKMAGVVAVLIVIGFVIWQAALWLMAPTYQLAISNQEITAANIEQLAAGPVSRLSATSPVHIRFQWEPGELKTDYLKIMVEREEGSSFVEEAVLGRRPPRTASYIYFMGPLDSGKYRIQVLDGSGSVLADRDLELQ
jgi:hypothetical protein